MSQPLSSDLFFTFHPSILARQTHGCSRRISHQKREVGLTNNGVGDHPPEVYNTGDLASEDELGRIHYHGRIDWQVEFLLRGMGDSFHGCVVFSR